MKKMKNMAKANKVIQRCIWVILILSIFSITQAKAQTPGITSQPGHAVICICDGWLFGSKKMKLLYDGDTSWVDLGKKLNIKPETSPDDIDLEYIMLMAGLSYMEKQGYELISSAYKKSRYSNVNSDLVLIFSLRKN